MLQRGSEYDRAAAAPESTHNAFAPQHEPFLDQAWRVCKNNGVAHNATAGQAAIMAELKGKQAARRVPTRTKTFVSARPQESRPGSAKPSSTGSRYLVQSLLVGLDVVEALAFAGADRGVTELASQLGTTKWRIFRHLHSLTEAGYVT